MTGKVTSRGRRAPADAMAPGHVLFGSAGSGSAAIEAALGRCGLPFRIVDAASWDAASALDELAPVIAARVRPGGRLALSGILDGQQDDLLARYREWFDELQVCRQGDWLRITGLRR